jgi:hydrogenase maturation factor
LSVVPEARIAMETGGVRAMHDPTEGGVATGLRELCMAAGIGLLVEEDALPILPESLSLCRRFGLDPLGVIASGALIIIMDPSMTTGLLSRLSEAGIAATVIGTMQDATFGVKIRRGKKLENLPVFRRDEIGKLFEPS